MFNLANLKVDFRKVENVFIEAVKDQAELRKAQVSQMALRIFPEELPNVAGEYGIKVRISSLVGAFEEEVVLLKELTFYDQGNHISRAFMQIFENEVRSHNTYLENNVKCVSVENYPNKIDLQNIELFVEVKNRSGQDELEMNMVYDFNKLRQYSIREEFKDAEKHLGEMSSSEIDNINELGNG